MDENRTFLNYFGSNEKPTVARWTAWRDRAFHPLCHFLARHNIHADSVTLVSFLLMAFFFIPFFGLGAYVPAWIVLVLHLFLDALDGPLSRVTGGTANRGALADIMNDMTGMVLVVVIATHTGFLYPTISVLYVASYLYLIILTIALNILGAGYNVVIKTKYWMYIALVYSVHSGNNHVVNFMCLGAIIYSIGYICFAYMRLRSRLPESVSNTNQNLKLQD